ncbi:DUF6774 domain-containing protein [Anaerovorax odorimutans]|uniref:DUF6774 domain-containing protein n=1 Tax=Anaerovorax odorimutans TaxID=109327 RepID=UPI00041412BE|nr:DUF6774 domain-containing protein [Anaerovorax odorimutans]
MNYGKLTATISSIAIMIANDITDEDELTLLSLMFTQLGDTLATISQQRSMSNILNNNSDSKEE